MGASGGRENTYMIWLAIAEQNYEVSISITNFKVLQAVCALTIFLGLIRPGGWKELNPGDLRSVSSIAADLVAATM
jgi:hypothetical protein